MATGGILSNGVKVGYSASSPVSWISVGQILNVEIPGLEPEEVETTVHGTSNFRRFMRGMIDVTEMTVTCLGDLDEVTSAAYDALFDYQALGTTLWWRVEVPVDRAQTEYTAFVFQGWVKNWRPVVGEPGVRQELEFSVRFDGTDFSKQLAGASAIT